MDYVDYHRQKLVKSEYDVIIEIEKVTGAIPIVSETNMFTFGIVIQDNHVVRLVLDNSGLTSLPESIGNLTSLQTLGLNSNKLTSLPEKIENVLNKLRDRGCRVSR